MTTFEEAWSKDIRRTHARLPETEIIRYTQPDRRTVVRIQNLTLETLPPPGDVLNLTV